MEMNDRLWRLIQEAEVEGGDARECLASLYRRITDRIGGPYWERCAAAAHIWCDRLA
jgi:hypothetical protein